MRLYSASERANIQLTSDGSLRRSLGNLCVSHHLTYILETGTHVGLGSTKFIVQTLAEHSCVPQKFVTIEANYWNWRKARHNLRSFSFVEPLWGLSTSRQEALRFISNDPAILDHHRYQDVFIDDVENPIDFYSNEIRGDLGGKSKNPMMRFRQMMDRRLYAGENLLTRWLHVFQSHAPLIVLDSAGGVGYLEFNKVQENMEEHPYFLLLDDIHHLKHFRSRQEIHANRRFEVIDENETAGWLLASYRP